MSYYVAVDIGCIECGEDSAVLGVFTSRDAAEVVCEDHDRRQREHWSGQHYFDVWEVDGIDKVMHVAYGDEAPDPESAP
jgi:hypothetical protein